MPDTEPRVIEYTVDGGGRWHHGRTIEAWAALDNAVLRGQRDAVRETARAAHGNIEHVGTRVLLASDPAGVLHQPPAVVEITVSDPRIQAARDAAGYTPRHDVVPPPSVLLAAYYDLRKATLGLLDVIDGREWWPAQERLDHETHRHAPGCRLCAAETRAAQARTAP